LPKPYSGGGNNGGGNNKGDGNKNLPYVIIGGISVGTGLFYESTKGWKGIFSDNESSLDKVEDKINNGGYQITQ
jgi:hypothetical protein